MSDVTQVIVGMLPCETMDPLYNVKSDTQLHFY